MLDKPSVIKRILDNLHHLEDRMNFGLSCRTINKILNEHSRTWENVWLDVAGVVETPEKFSLSNRNYSKLKWRNIDKTPKSLIQAEIITRLKPIESLASSVRMLKLHYVEDLDLDREIQLVTFCLMTFEKLQHLEIEVQEQICWARCWRRKNLPAEDVQQRQPSINLKDLEYLKIPLNLLDFLIDNRILEITSSKLKTFKAVGYEYRPERSTSYQLAILDVIKKQESLEYFEIGGDYSFLFNVKLQLKSKLHYFIHCCNSEYEEQPELSHIQQDNMVEFLTSQTALQKVFFVFDGESSPKMLQYRVKNLQLPQQTRKVTIKGEPTNLIGTNIFNTEEFGIMSLHQANTSVKSLSITLEDMNEDQWISDFAVLFPNLSQLNVSGVKVNLQRLGELRNLQRLKMSCWNHPLCPGRPYTSSTRRV